MQLTPSFAALTPTGRLQNPIKRIIAIRDGPNPSFDYFVAPRLGTVPFEIRDRAEEQPHTPAGEGWSGALVVFCRYLSTAWLDIIERHRTSLAGVALFLDDDIDAMFEDSQVPVWYRLRVYRRHLRFRLRLQGRLDFLLVSNPRIAFRHAATHRVLSPVAGPQDESRWLRPDQQGMRVAFHSTSVHRREHRWLRPVLAAALQATPDLQAEIVAEWGLARQWQRLPRTTVIAPVSWPRFRAETAHRGADLLLAPLLPGVANAARAPTKRIDAMRLGAALLTSNPAVYNPGDEEIELGMSLRCDPALWSKAISDLARDSARLRRLRELNRHIVLESAATARWSGLLDMPE